jgi:hypothetical protein
MRITTMVVFILIGSTCFSVVFLGVSGGVWLEHHLTSLPGGVWGFLIFINIFIFFLAFFLDFFEIAFIILPMIAPIAQKVLTPVVGPDAALIWFGVMLCVNMQTSFLHPPFGFALFYLRGVAPKEVKSSDIYWGALPWIGLQLIMVAGCAVASLSRSVVRLSVRHAATGSNSALIHVHAPGWIIGEPTVSFATMARSNAVGSSRELNVVGRNCHDFRYCVCRHRAGASYQNQQVCIGIGRRGTALDGVRPIER